MHIKRRHKSFISAIFGQLSQCSPNLFLSGGELKGAAPVARLKPGTSDDVTSGNDPLSCLLKTVGTAR